MNITNAHRFLSPDGRCHTFDENANGYARGEGIGCLILKPLVDAIRDGDTIRAVIRGSGSNQDGRTPGITLPSGALQEVLIRDVYNAAGLDPVDTEYVETHGTGTQAGDPIETEALSKVFGPGRPSDIPLRIGSIKTNVGHLEGTSGVAGVMKAVLMLENRTFLPNRNFKTLNPRIPLQEWNLKVGSATLILSKMILTNDRCNWTLSDGKLRHLIVSRSTALDTAEAMHILFSRTPQDIYLLAISKGPSGDQIKVCFPFDYYLTTIVARIARIQLPMVPEMFNLSIEHVYS